MEARWSARGNGRVKISYDPHKRARTLEERGLDFDDAVHVFAGATLDAIDDRKDYGERRWQTYGMLADRLLMVVWTERDGGRHIISMRKANDREQAKYRRQLGS
jgi:uncharacterized DUF497 family protein